MAVKMGYKQTEVGVIPEEWDVKPLQELCIAILDCHHSTPVWTKAGAVVIRNQNIRDGKLDLSEASFTNDQHFAERTRRATPMFGDLVITREAPMGLVCMIPEGLRCCLGQRMVLLRLNCEEASSTYVLYALLGEDVQRSISVAGGTGSTVSNLRIPVLKQLKIFVPGLPEQQAIATALSDVDALLSALERLLAKKRDLKQATMQQLLTGQTRLPNFHGEWEMKRIGDIAPLQRGFDLPNPSLRPGPYPVVYSNGVMNHHAHAQVQGPGVVTGRSGTIGNVTFVDGPFWPHNTALWVTSFRGNDPRFVFYLYTEINFERFATGSGVPTLNRNDVHSFEVVIPPYPEQTAIAAVLSDMDAELASLEQRLAKTRALKQGMMQELLTGRTRLL